MVLRLKYGAAFTFLAFACEVVALEVWNRVGWIAVLPLYGGLSLALLAVAYFGIGPGLLFKRINSSRNPLGWILFAPYLILNGLVFRLYRMTTREPACAQVTDRLFFGRRLSGGETERAVWNAILDLAAEFPASRVTPWYLSIPVLDGTAPTEEQLRISVDWICKASEAGPVYVHCALGHSRSACVVVAYLLSTGAVNTVAEGIALLRSRRPGVNLNSGQLRVLQSISCGNAASPRNLDQADANGEE